MPQVKAIKMGFFGGARRREGEVFDMTGVKVKEDQIVGVKNGKPVTWVKPADEESSGPKALGASATGKQSTSEGSSESVKQ